MERGRPCYFLYVGNLKLHKNLMRLLSAVALFRNCTKLDWKLLIVGPGNENASKQLLRHSAQLGISDCVCFLNNVSHDLLPSLYRKAQFLVLPSLLEGFGLSIVEAMACGTPVVCSNAASLPEVAGNAALFFDPFRVEDIADAMEAVATSPDLRAKLRQNGLRTAGQFSWEESAKRHVEVFQRFVQS
jgi:glycosyltransferase involved in cell wall biosynthesis